MPQPLRTLLAGLALFSMFFGAGNVVFPLNMGQLTASNTGWAVTGFLMTAVGIPFLGLFAVILFEGNYRAFFKQLGPIPGQVLICILMGLIGPFGGAPRCMTLAFETLKVCYPNLSFEGYTLFAALLVFALAYKKNYILTWLGSVLTPLLLLALSAIVWGSWNQACPISYTASPAIDNFFIGLKEGYQTMDLLASFFFASLALNSLKASISNPQDLLPQVLKASAIAACLLSIVYLAFAYVGAGQSPFLQDVDKGSLLGVIAQRALGERGALFAAALTALACLTTAIALVSVFSLFIVEEGFYQLSYQKALLITVAITYLVARLQFQGITAFLIPIVEVVYPTLIALCSINAWQQIRGKKISFWPVLAVFILSLASKLFSF